MAGTAKFPAKIFIAVGLGLFAILGTIGVLLGVNEIRHSSWPTTQGTVVDVKTHIDYDSSSNRKRRNNRPTTMYVPQVEYTVDGQQYRFTSKVSTSEIWAVGDTTVVRHDPDDPAKGEIAGQTVWVPFLLIGLGVLFGAVFGGAGFAINRSQSKQVPTTAKSPSGPKSRFPAYDPRADESDDLR